MGLTAAEWTQVSAAGAEMLGTGWVPLGKGRKIQVWRVPVGWWAQHVYHENSSSGRFVGWGSLLAKPLATSQLGDSGQSMTAIRYTAEREIYRSMRDVHDPSALVRFTNFVDQGIFAKDRDLESALEDSEKLYAGWRERWEHHPYYGNTRQLLVMLRVLTGSRSLPELIDDVRWVVEDELLGGSNEKSLTFYPQLLETLESADRPSMEALLLGMRQENLAELGVPAEFVTDVSVPQPKVPW